MTAMGKRKGSGPRPCQVEDGRSGHAHRCALSQLRLWLPPGALASEHLSGYKYICESEEQPLPAGQQASPSSGVTAYVRVQAPWLASMAYFPV